MNRESYQVDQTGVGRSFYYQGYSGHRNPRSVEFLLQLINGAEDDEIHIKVFENYKVESDNDDLLLPQITVILPLTMTVPLLHALTQLGLSALCF